MRRDLGRHPFSLVAPHPRRPLACSSDLAGLWHNDGARAVFFGTYAEASAIVPAVPALVTGPVAETLFREVA